MSETTEVLYVCTVVVQVDLESKEVVRVQVDDEGVKLDPAELEAAKSDPDTAAAVEIAEGDSLWPAWEFGF